MIESRIGYAFKQKLQERRQEYLEHLATGVPSYDQMVGRLAGMKEAAEIYDDVLRELTGE